MFWTLSFPQIKFTHFLHIILSNYNIRGPSDNFERKIALYGKIYIFQTSACDTQFNQDFLDFSEIGVFMSGTLEVPYWQMRAQPVSGPMGPMGGWVTKKQWMLAENPVMMEPSVQNLKLEPCTKVLFVIITNWYYERF